MPVKKDAAWWKAYRARKREQVTVIDDRSDTHIDPNVLTHPSKPLVSRKVHKALEDAHYAAGTGFGANLTQQQRDRILERMAKPRG